MYSLNIEITHVDFHETSILNKNRILILCLDENLDEGNPLVYVEILFRCLVFGVAMSGELIWTQYGSAYRSAFPAIR